MHIIISVRINFLYQLFYYKQFQTISLLTFIKIYQAQMIQDKINDSSYLSNMTPQMRKNRKSLQIGRINHRISLLKKQLNKHKHQTSLDKNRLMEISQQAKVFERKVFDEILKCNQLKKNSLEPDKNKNCDNLRQQNKTGDFIQKQNPNKKNNQNQTNNQNRQLTRKPTLQIQSRNNMIAKHKNAFISQGNSKSNPCKRPKNDPAKINHFGQKNKTFYFKETFITTIIFIILGTIFRQSLLIL